VTVLEIKELLEGLFEGYDVKPCSLKNFKGLLSNVIG
jgi:hypothetical protein